MRETIMGALTVLLGFAFIAAGILDFIGHFLGFSSPWPWWGNVIFAALGVLLLFPDRIALAARHGRHFLPWNKTKP